MIINKHSLSNKNDLLNDFKAKASKAKQAQSRVKALEKLDRVDAIEGDEASMTLKFTLDKKSGKEVVQAKSISKAYDKAEIFKQHRFYDTSWTENRNYWSQREREIYLAQNSQ